MSKSRRTSSYSSQSLVILATWVVLAFGSMVAAGALGSVVFALISFSLVGACIHLGWNKPSLLGKQTNGKLAWWSLLLNGPFLFCTWLGWRLRALTKSEQAYHFISPGIMLGRRLTDEEAKQVEFKAVIDMTAEISESEHMLKEHYLSLPVTDRAAPTPAQLKQAYEFMKTAPRPIYIHCLAGHGRSATVVAFFLMKQGMASSVDEAVHLIRHHRPTAGPTASQRAALRAAR